MGILRKSILLLLILLPLFAEQVVDRVAIHGNAHLSTWKIEQLMRTKRASFLKRAVGKDEKFSPKRLEDDLGILRDYYINQGYIDAVVKATATPRPKEPQKLLINVFITEGQRYIVDEIRILGDLPQGMPSQELVREMKLAVGEPITPRLVRTDSRHLQSYLRNRGYPYAEVTGKHEVAQDSLIIIEMAVTTGKAGYFGGIIYVGLDNTRQSAVSREIAFKNGDIFSAAKVTETREALYRTGLFSIVSVEAMNLALQPETLDYKITVAEKPPRWVITRFGAGSDEKYPIFIRGGLGWGHRNLFGTGRSFTIEASSKWEIVVESSGKFWPNTAVYNMTNRFDVTYREPWIFGSRTPLSLNLYFEPLNREEIEQYKLRTIGFEIDVEHRANYDWRHNLTFNYERADIYDIENPELREEILHRREKPISRRIGYSAVRDKRDNVLVPTAGSYFVGQLEMGGYFLGGDENYTKVSLLNSRYWSIFNRYIFAVRGRTSIIGNWKAGEEDVLEHRKFYLGGANTIRGWGERSIGPKFSDGQPRGGKMLALANAEVRAPLIWNFWGHVFFDMGNLWEYAEAFNPGQLKGSAGWGLAFITPIGPLRFDYGYQIMNKDVPVADEKISNSSWHLSIMYAF
jgi:outer membrane protein insertion porin family